jgi:uncharacterized protein (DUF1330 family)
MPWGTIIVVLGHEAAISSKGGQCSQRSKFIVFTRTKTLDQKELETYWAGIKTTMKGHPIEVLVAYGKHEVLEGDPIEGIVIAKFPTVKAKDWYCGEAYPSVAKHRQKGAIYQGLIVEGVI